MFETIEKHVKLFSDFRVDMLGIDDTLKEQFTDTNNFLLLLKANNFHVIQDLNEKNAILIFCGLFCYSQAWQ